MIDSTIAFLGAGKMATALARGFVTGGLVEGPSLVASDASPAALEAFTQTVPGAKPSGSNADAAAAADIVIVAVKPQYLADVLADIHSVVDKKKLVMSIAAGFSLERLAAGLASGVRLVRVMPNTPCLVGHGASAFSLGEHATRQDAATASKLLGAVGAAYEVPEALLDPVTGLSGSGPAFVYTVIEALADAGVRVGLPRGVASDLAARTVAGAAQMVIETGDHPALLREAVTSPGGTTAAGLAQLDRHGLRHALAEAVRAATERAKQLGAD